MASRIIPRILRTSIPRTTSIPCTCNPSLLQTFNSFSKRSFSSSPSTQRISDDFINIIQTDAARPAVSIATLSPKDGFTLTDGLVIPTPILLINSVVFLWDVAAPAEDGSMNWEGWNEEKLKAFEVITPRPEILLVGTGKKGLFPPPSFKKYLNGLGIQVDVLDSRNACSTYNLLSEEGRRVAAAIYPLTAVNARTGEKIEE